MRHEEKGTKTHQVRDVDLNDLALVALIDQKPHSFMRGPDAVIFFQGAEGEKQAHITELLPEGFRLK